MRCEEVREKLQDLLDGLLNDEQKRAVESHLRECSNCASEFDGLKRLVASLRSLPKYRAPDILKARLESAIRGEKLSLWRSVATLSSAAAALLLVLLLISLQWQPVKTEPTYVPPEAGRVQPDFVTMKDEKVARREKVVGKGQGESLSHDKTEMKAPSPEEEKKQMEETLVEGAPKKEREKQDEMARKEPLEELSEKPKTATGRGFSQKAEPPAPGASPVLDGNRDKGFLPPSQTPSSLPAQGQKEEKESRKKLEDRDRLSLDEEARKEQGLGIGGASRVAAKKGAADKYLKEIEEAMKSSQTERKEVRLKLTKEEAEYLLKQLSSMAEEDEKIAKRSEVRQDDTITISFSTDERGYRVLLAVLKPEKNLLEDSGADERAGGGKEADKDAIEKMDKKAKETVSSEVEGKELKKIEVHIILEIVKGTQLGK